MQQQDIDTLAAGKKPTGVVLLDIEDAQLTPGIVKDTYFLTVSGTKPWLTMKVEFLPLIYVRQPEYWGIQIVGVQSGIGLPATAPFTHTEEVTQYLGTKGVEAIGANKKIGDFRPESRDR